jgi:ribosomal protein S10
VCKVGHISKTVDPTGTKINKPCVFPVMKILQIEKLKSVHFCKTNRERRKMAIFPKLLIRLAPKTTGLEVLQRKNSNRMFQTDRYQNLTLSQAHFLESFKESPKNRKVYSIFGNT